MTAIVLDTGPLCAYLCEGDQDHAWAREQFASFKDPLFTCEPVLTESAYLVAQRGGRIEHLWEFVRRGVLKIDFRLEAEFEAIAQLMRRYADVPMDLADACLVRMSELHRDCRVLTTDSDFKFYRRYHRQVIPLISP